MVASKQHAPARLLISENLKNQRDGAPGEIRTPDLLVRSQTLYPTELRARNAWHVYQGDDDFSKSLKNQDLLSSWETPVWGRVGRLPSAGRASYHTLDGL
jgi:hypothetical protein